MVGLGAVVVGIAKKVGGASSASASGGSATLALPAGAQIQEMQVSGSRLILRVKTDRGEEIDIVDTSDGRVVSRISAAPPEISH